MEARRRWSTLLVGVLIVGLIAAGCSSGAGTSTTDPVADTGATETTPEGTDAPSDPGGGDPVSVRLQTFSPDYDPIRSGASLALARNWRELGIEVEVTALGDVTQYYNILREQPDQMDAAIGGLVSRPERLDPDAMLHPTFYTDGGSNFGGYSNPEMDELLDAQRSELDTEARREIVFDIQDMVFEEAPGLTLYHLSGLYAYNKDRFADVVPMLGFGIFNEWTLTQATPLTDDETMVIANEADITSLNPLAENLTQGMQNLRLIYDTLAKVDPAGEPVPWAAESWEVLDPQTIEVALRPDMEFHDGEPVTAEDVAFSINLMKESGLPEAFASSFNPVDEVEVVDDLTLRVHTVEPYAPIFITLFTQAYIFPQHIWEEVANDDSLGSLTEFTNEEPIGSGPFRFLSYNRGQELRMERNPDHFRAPSIDYTYRVYASADAVFNALRLAEADSNVFKFLPTYLEQAEATEHLELVTVPDFGIYYVLFNVRDGSPFQDKALRRALAHTVPYEEIVSNILQGQGVPGQGFIAPANEYWHNPAASEWLEGEYAFDLEAARTVLEEAGYTWDEEGRLLAPAS